MLKNIQIAAYQYPATVILIDDSKSFLTTACFEIDERIAYRLFDNPERALQFIKDEYKPSLLTHKILSDNQDINVHSSQQHGINFDITAIHKEVYNPQRFKEIAVIVVDYNMPKLNGLDLCRQLKGTPIKIILVTGEADERIAVQAFNDGIINKFILKNISNFTEVINNSIFELQQSYFQGISEGIIKPLLAVRECAINQPAFSSFFYGFCKEHNVAEFYLYDPAGSFMLLDYDGNVSWLIVKSAAEMNDYYDLAHDSHAPASVLEYLKEGKMLPFFQNFQQLDKVKGMDWEKHLYPAKRLKIEQAFFYAFIQNKNQLLPEHQKVLSYNNYINRVWPR